MCIYIPLGVKPFVYNDFVSVYSYLSVQNVQGVYREVACKVHRKGC